MKKFIFIVIAFFLLTNLYAENRADFAMYNLKAKEARISGLYDSSLYYLDLACKLSSDYSDSIYIYNSYGITYYKITDYYTAKLYLDSALQLSVKNKYENYLPYIYQNLGLIYTETEEFRKGLDYLFKALNGIADKTKGFVFNDIGRCYRFMGDIDSSTYYLRKAYNFKLKYLGADNYSTLSTGLELYRNTKDKKLIKSLKEPILKSNNQYLLGRYYYFTEQYDKAELYLQGNWFMLLLIYNQSNQFDKAIDALDSLRNSYTDIESKLFIQANERLIYKKAIDDVVKKDTVEAFKIALRSRGNILKEDLHNKLTEFPPSYNYYVFDSVIYLFIVDNKIDFYKIDADTIFLENYFKMLNTLPLGNVYSDYYKGYRDFCESSYFVYKKLIPEIKEDMNIIPDGYLYYLPFDVLLTEFPSDTSRPVYKVLPYLMLKSNIHYDHILRNYKQNKNRLDFTLLAPDEKLLYTQKLAKKFWRYRGNICRKDKATTEMAQKGDILHIEAHYNPPEDFIRLADTTFLFNKLDSFPKEMVVISTCYSGYGENYKGEGIFSPGRSFYSAGAKCVIESFWSNDDISSYMIMKEFYKNLDKGYTKSRALKLAKIKYLEDCRDSKSHPYYWAHSKIFGDNQPVKIKKKTPILILSGLGLIIIIVFCKYFFRFIRKQTFS